MEKIKLISIVGPTASGKTALSIALAKKFNGEIISADSMQIYKYMDIATAKPSLKEREGIPHHLMDFVDPVDEYSVAGFVDDARKVIYDIHCRGKLPVLVGGTGLYVNSLLNNIQFTNTGIDEKLREDLMSKSNEELLNILADVDEESYNKLVVERNHKRIARALEIYYLTGKPKSVVDKESLLVESPFSPVKIGLNVNNREFLYNRINRRVDIMVENGLLDEGKIILNKKLSSTASKAIGYKEFIPYFENKATLDECKEILKRETRRYAKRQLTWFKRDKEINWLSIDEYSTDELIKKASDIVSDYLCI